MIEPFLFVVGLVDSTVVGEIGGKVRILHTKKAKIESWYGHLCQFLSQINYYIPNNLTLSKFSRPNENVIKTS